MTSSLFFRANNKTPSIVTPSEGEGSVKSSILSDSSTPPPAPLGMTVVPHIHHILLKLTGFQTRIGVSPALTSAYRNLSFPRKRESTVSMRSWMPAFAGMTGQIGQFEYLRYSWTFFPFIFSATFPVRAIELQRQQNRRRWLYGLWAGPGHIRLSSSRGRNDFANLLQAERNREYRPHRPD